MPQHMPLDFLDFPDKLYGWNKKLKKLCVREMLTLEINICYF